MSRALHMYVMVVGLFFAGPAFANDFARKSPLKAIEAYTFVLPAIDCYRDTTQEITTSQKALQQLLRIASDSLRDDQVEEMTAAASKGAKAYERLIASNGREAYCKTINQKYGSKGTVFRGLVIAKS